MNAIPRFAEGPLGSMYTASVNAYFTPRAKAFSHFNRKATLEPTSAAFVRECEITVLGDNGKAFPNTAVLSEAHFKWNSYTEGIFDRILQILPDNDPLPYMRGGAPYYAGPFANKQLINWLKPGHKDHIIGPALDVYRTDYWKETCLPVLHRVLDTENAIAHRGIDMAQSDPEWILIGDKDPGTGTGYAGIRTRMDAAKMVARGKQLGMSPIDTFIHDVDVWTKGQHYLWDRWPDSGVWISGFSGFKGTLAGSRSDVDVIAIYPDGMGGWVERFEATTRGVNITPVSLFSNKHVLPRRESINILESYKAAGYTIRPRDVIRRAFAAPPITCTFVTDIVNIGGDYGFTMPTPTVTGDCNNWHLNMPKEIDKSGADAMIGIGSGSIGCTGIFIPEWSSGRIATRLGYEVFCDWNVVHWLALAAVKALFMTSIGDDQNVTVKYEDIPPIFETPLPRHLRLKGSKGNTEFRLGKQCVFIDADHVAIFSMPRPIKTVTSAVRSSLGSQVLAPGDTAMLRTAEHAAESADRTWAVDPAVFYWEGNPKEAGLVFTGQAFQGNIKQAIAMGIIDEHTSLYINEDDEAVV